MKMQSVFDVLEAVSEEEIKAVLTINSANSTENKPTFGAWMQG